MKKYTLLFLVNVLLVFTAGNVFADLGTKNELSGDELEQLERFYSTQAELLPLIQERQDRYSEISPDIYNIDLNSVEDTQKYRMQALKVENDISARVQAVYKKYGITREAYQATAVRLLRHPETMLAYKKAGGKVPDSLINRDRAQEPSERLASAGIALDPLNDKTISAALRQAGNPLVRADIITVLGDMNDPVALPHITPFIDDEDIFTRIASGRALCKLGNEAGVPALLDILFDYGQPDMLRMSAAIPLKSCKDSEIVNEAILKSLRDDPNGYLRWQLAMEYQFRSDTKDMQKLEPFLERLDQLIEINEHEKSKFAQITNIKTINNLQHRKEEIDRIRESERKHQEFLIKVEEFNRKPHEERARLIRESGGKSPIPYPE